MNLKEPIICEHGVLYDSCWICTWEKIEPPVVTWLFKCRGCYMTWTTKATGKEQTVPRMECPNCAHEVTAGF